MNDIIDFLDNYEASKPKKQRKQPYRKPKSVKELELMAFVAKCDKYPNTDPKLLAPFHFRDDTANGLTACIVKYLELKKCFAGRVNTQGTYNKKLGKYIYSGAKKGMADISAVINGKHISIEVKVGKDKPRPEQLKVKEQVEQAGGVYIFVSSFDNFLSQVAEYENNIDLQNIKT